MKPEWRTTNVVQLCMSFRETQDNSTLPILADALQDADCNDDSLLIPLRSKIKDSAAILLVAQVFSEETQNAVNWLNNFCNKSDCPEIGVTFAAAIGKHEENTNPDEDPFSGYYCSENDGEYLFFGGRDAHGNISQEFWDNVQKILGKPIPEGLKAEGFSCSC